MKTIRLAAALSMIGSAAFASTAGLNGYHYDSPTGFNSISAARTIIADAVAPTAEFRATALDYANVSAATSLSDWLGANGTITSGTSVAVATSVFLFTGYIDLAAGLNTFSVSSDDGFELLIDGSAAGAFDGNRGYGTSTFNFDAGAGGERAFELLFWDGPGGSTGLKVTLNGAVVDDSITSTDPSTVPVPAGLPLLLSALVAAGLAGRARRSA